MDIISCDFCNTILKSKYNLKNHLSTNKKCLTLRGLKMESEFICKGCDSFFANKTNMIIHMDICKKYIKLKIEEEYEEKIISKDKQISDLKINIDENKDLQLKYTKLEVKYEDLKEQHEKMISKLERKIYQTDSFIQDIVTERINSFNNEVVIEINNDNFDDNFDEKEEYKLTPLDLGNDLHIENRYEDGYINVTNLCKAGNKKFNDWNRIDNTKAFLKELSRSAGIPADLLIHSDTGGKNEDRKTWVHPYVAINIAQWISPQFYVKVSSWIYEVMLTGKIDISKTKSFQQLRLENKEQKLRIQYLTKKYVKLQPRVQYNEKNVIYILSTTSHKKEGKYILGKATNLTNRLSTYNKTDEHEVVYYQECPDEDTMTMVEQVVFQRLKDYREQANRERFILPENKTIELFIDVIKKSIEFLK